MACFPLCTGVLHATGWFGPAPRWLESGGIRSQAAPEFFWDIELKRIAAEVAEKDCPFPYRPAGPREEYPAGMSQYLGAGPPEEAPEQRPWLATARADEADFATALKAGRLKVTDEAAATAAHHAMRVWLDAKKYGKAAGEAPGGEAPGEFADYHAGCAAAVQEEAIAVWEKLLARPQEERHYRSVWSAFMLGKTRWRAGDFTGAVEDFRRTRELARAGCADSLALAAESYGWEGQCELEQKRYAAAARLFLQQLALGDGSAVLSLRAVVPPLPQQDASPDEGKELWDLAARDPLLRRVVTAHVLATETVSWRQLGESKRCVRWLRAINEAGVRTVEDSAALGWTAYATGKYAEAARWLALERKPTTLGRWLKAKLALREGRFDEAAKILPGVISALPPDDGLREYDNDVSYLPGASARADLAVVRLAAGDAPGALEAWYLGCSESDCAHLAERVLTTEELGRFITKRLPQLPSRPTVGRLGEDGGLIGDRLRSIYGRRLVREGRPKEGRAFLSEPERTSLANYLQALGRVEKKGTPPAERARALFDAALIMQREGAGFRGTIEEFNSKDFENSDHNDPLVIERTTGVAIRQGTDPVTFEEKTITGLPTIPAGREERRRLAATAPERAISMRTAVLAAGLAKKAAALLQDNTEELADVLDTAGSWIEDLDNPAADKIFAQLEKRCSNTAIGRAAIARHWFTRAGGPWSGKRE